MSSIYIVDDDLSIVNILKDIIEKNFDGCLLGSAVCGKDAMKEIIDLKPEIVLLDYLLPDKDGLEIIRGIRAVYTPVIVMISEVSDKRMIAKAYKEKIEFFINKPINVIEILSVIEKVNEYLMMKKTIHQFENAISSIKKISDFKKDDGQDLLYKLKKLYGKLGIIGSSGCDELIKAVCFAKSRKGHYNLAEVYKSIVIDPNDENQIYAVEKRIRRIVVRAFKIMAALGVEDPMHFTFENYGSQLFDFVELRKEMKYIRGEWSKQGKINVKQFIESSILLTTD